VEAKTLAKLNHPGIVGIHNMGVDAGQFPYLVMDLLSGESLDLLIRKSGRLQMNQALDLFIQVSDALSSAHQQGIIHRDIKPSNLMLVRDASNQVVAAKIVDFGIARLSKHGFAAQSQTATGLVFGTPFYMSPEQCEGLRVDERSDIYSLGCALFETLTGRPPFCGDNAFHTFMLHQTEAPPSLASVTPDGSFPPSLEQAIQKLLAKEVSDRYQTMAQVKHDLERVRAGKEIMARGLSTTIAPSTQPVSAAGRSLPITEDKSRSQAVERAPVEGGRALSRGTVVSLISLLVLIVAASCAFLWSRPAKAPLQKGVKIPAKINSNSVQDKASVLDVVEIFDDQNSPLKVDSSLVSRGLVSDEVLKKAGTSDKEISDLRNYDFSAAARDEHLYHPKLIAYLTNHRGPAGQFKKRAPKLEFQFPSNFILGAVQFGNEKPLQATGNILIPPAKRICFYLSYSTRDCLQILDMFGPDDLNGLEVVFDKPTKAIEKISHWKKLDDLSFFNPLQKVLPNYAQFDESPIADSDLPLLEQLSGLRSLGLCGDNVSGQAISKMPMLRRIETLKIKRIKGIESVLNVLPSLQNIKELWLVSTNTTDEQIASLARMNNLTTLRIRRSLLTPASLKYFRQMPALKHLYLDRPWSDSDKKQFRKAIPGCEFESVLDRTYWKYFPIAKPDGNNQAN
jgi:hypothetical protein